MHPPKVPAEFHRHHPRHLSSAVAPGKFTEDDIRAGSELWRRAEASIERRHPGFLAGTDDKKLRVKRVANDLIGVCIRDLVDASHARILASGVRSPDEVRSTHAMLIGHGDEIRPLVAELQAFLYARFYRHPDLMALSEYARKVLALLFGTYCDRPTEMSPWYQDWAREVGLQRAVCDYVAGMTDRFAEQEYARFTAGSASA